MLQGLLFPRDFRRTAATSLAPVLNRLLECGRLEATAPRRRGVTTDLAKRILHPSDFSPASRPAFKKAIELAKKDRATLEVVHVMAPITPMPGSVWASPRTYDAWMAAATGSARKSLERLLKQARAAGVRATSTIVMGMPADRIVRTARTRRADLIVMGTHGRSGLSRFLLGSVASRVIAMSPCPVLTVRGT